MSEKEEWSLGINDGINSSVVWAKGRRIVFALQEERVSRKKETHGFPEHALPFSLKYLGIDPASVRTVCLNNLGSPPHSRDDFLEYYEAKATPLMRRMVRFQPDVVTQLAMRYLPETALRSIRDKRVKKPNAEIEAMVRDQGFSNAEISRIHHHRAHGASAYFGCRENADDPHLVLTLDGGGDFDVAHVYIAEAGSLREVATTSYGHSIGNIYSCTTQALGMTPHEHEYKLMGMAAYSNPDYFGEVLDRYRSYLDLDPANPLTFRRNVPEPTDQITRRLLRDFERARFDNVCGALQCYTEELLVKWVKACVSKTGISRVVGAGGVFMNVKANKVIAELPEVTYFDVFPSCGDESLPFGSLWARFAEANPEEQSGLGLDHYYLGTDAGFDLEEARTKFGDRGLEFRSLDDPNQVIAELLSEGKVVARCSGPMEFGARALGNRSILANPADGRVIPIINKMIKKRDFWMPFAPAMLREDVERYIRIPDTIPRDQVSPYMMHTFDTTEERDAFQAGVHQHDHTARAQVVSETLNPDFHDLICKLKGLTGHGVILNTSFNLHGYPIVHGVIDAVEVLLNSGLTHLIVNDTLITKRNQ